MKDPRYAIRREPTARTYLLTFQGHLLGAYRRKRDALSHGVEHNRNRLNFG